MADNSVACSTAFSPELQATKFSLDPEYEYCQIEIKHVRKSLLQQTAKDLAEGKINIDNPAVVSMMSFADYVEKELPEAGWECYELAHQGGQLHELRRFRRKIS